MGTFGRGENVRLLVEDAGVKYEYIRFGEDTWPGAKTALAEKLPSSTVPYIITAAGQHYNKTYPILRFVSRKLGKFAGRSDEEAQRSILLVI